jgi:hypothetical protein
MSILQYHYYQTDGGAPMTADAISVVAAFVPTAGSDVTIASGDITNPDVPRRVKVYQTDANSTITGTKVYLTGTDIENQAIQETITLGTGTTSGTSVYAYRSFTSIIYHVDGVVTAVVDTLSIGPDVALGIPTAIEALDDILRKIVDTAADAGTVSLTYHTWEPTGGNVPNGSKAFTIEYLAA